MLSWVTDCERSNKPLLCPVCKSTISLEGPWDPIVTITDVVAKRFTRASPIMLLTSVAMGVQFSMQMYGAFALWAFSGRETLVQFMLGPEVNIGGQTSRILRFPSERIGNALVLMNVGPALLMGQLTPWLGNKIFLPTASLYGVYHVMHDEHFLSWPPTPQLAMAIFPYIRSAYLNFWREFVFPYEVNLNRRIMGLPPLEPRQGEEQPAADQPAAPQGNNDPGAGVVGFLNNLIDALEPDDDDGDDNGGEGARAQLRIDGDEVEGGLVLDIVIEEDTDDEEGNPVPNNQEQNGGDQDRPAADVPRQPAAVPANPPAGDNQHEAPQAPPARRPGIGSILSGVSNAIVSALILPGISFVMGELLRLALPKSWTMLSRSPWYRPSGLGRPGLFQQQWGRSLVGGCLWVVMKDVIRLYTKYRKVAAIGQRRVKNVERNRRGK